MNNSLIDEDRNFGGQELYIDLIPKSCWFTNVRYCISKNDWNILRKIIYERVNYKCECCNIDCKQNNISIEAHERWYYDYNTKTQKLMRLIALCRNCHLATHYGYAKISGKEKIAINQLLKVRNCSIIDLNKHINYSFSVWKDRNEYEWNLDLDLILKNNFKIINYVNKNDRKRIVDNKL